MKSNRKIIFIDNLYKPGSISEEALFKLMKTKDTIEIIRSIENFYRYLKKIIIQHKKQQEIKKIDLVIIENINVNNITLNKILNLMTAYRQEIEFPLIVITSPVEDKEERAKAFKKGIHEYILKPYTLDEFKSRIKRLLKLKEMKEKISKLKKESLKDPLTGLWNKRAIQKEFERIYEMSSRYKMDFSISIIDFDNFKKYNDTYGHIAGDEALKIFAKVINDNIRKSDFAGRFGGEEFILILPYTTEEGAKVLTKRILNQLMEKNIEHINNPPHKILTFTAGIAFREDFEDIITVIQKADEALYCGKKTGNKIVGFKEIV